MSKQYFKDLRKSAAKMFIQFVEYLAHPAICAEDFLKSLLPPRKINFDDIDWNRVKISDKAMENLKRFSSCFPTVADAQKGLKRFDKIINNPKQNNAG